MASWNWRIASSILAFLVEGDAEVVVGEGVIRFEADGFLELADRLVDLAFLLEGVAEDVVRDVIVLRDFERMPEKGFTVLPITDLLPRQRQAEDDRPTTRHRQRQHLIPPASGQFARAPDGEDQHPQRRKISIPIRHRLAAGLDQLAHGHQRPAIPQPPHQQEGIPPPLHPNQHRNAQDQPTRQQHLPQRPIPGVRIENRQIRRPEHLPQIAAIRNQRVPAARAQGQAFPAANSASALLYHEGHDARNAAKAKNGAFSQTSFIQGKVRRGWRSPAPSSALRIPHSAFLLSGQ